MHIKMTVKLLEEILFHNEHIITDISYDEETGEIYFEIENSSKEDDKII